MGLEEELERARRAVVYGDVALIRAIVRDTNERINGNSTDPTLGSTLLHLACSFCRVEIVRYLLSLEETGADNRGVLTPAHMRTTPLSVLARSYNRSTILVRCYRAFEESGKRLDMNQENCMYEYDGVSSLLDDAITAGQHPEALLQLLRMGATRMAAPRQYMFESQKRQHKALRARMEVLTFMQCDARRGPRRPRFPKELWIRMLEMLTPRYMER